MNKLATVFSLVLALLIFGGAVQSVEAKSVSWQKSLNLELGYYWNYGGAYTMSGWATGLKNPDVTVRYHADVINCDTGESLSDTASVPVDTRLKFVPRPHQDTDIYWFGTGYSQDSPYGHWVNDAGAPGNRQCLSQDFLGNDTTLSVKATYGVYVPLNINPPDSVTVTQGGTAVLGAADEVGCREVETAGTIVPTFTFGDTYGKFYYRYTDSRGSSAPGSGYIMSNGWKCVGNDAPMQSFSYLPCSIMCPSPGSSPYTLSVPTQSITFNLTATDNNNPPNPPIITGPQQTYPNTTETYCFVATDPDNDTIQYGIDWNNDGDVNTWTEFVPSGTQLCRPYQWPTTGTKSFKALTQDSKGARSTFTPYTVNVINQPVALTLSCSLSPTTVNIGQSVTWTATAAGGQTPYTYSWSGSESLTGTTQSVSKSYTQGGTKSAVVTLTDANGQTLTKTCAIATVRAPLSITACAANPSTAEVGQSVSWWSSVSGGQTPYTFSWSGTDGLSGNTQTITKTYAQPGTKNGSVRVTDANGQTSNRNCTAATIINNCTPELSVSRPAIRMGESVTISWDACLESCTLSQSGIAPQTVTGVGSQDVTLQGTTDFTLSCPSGTDTERVRVLPRVQET